MCYNKKMENNFESFLKNMILSASGWRGIFVKSQDEEDNSSSISNEHKALVTFAAKAFSTYMIDKSGNDCCLVVGTDSRPTGKVIADTMLRAMISCGITVRYVGIVAAPEIMSYARETDGFVYVSASHNPIGHNGIKFGFSDGGVMPGSEAKILIDNFMSLCNTENPLQFAESIIAECSEDAIQNIYNEESQFKKDSYKAYYSFSKQVISGEENKEKQNDFFDNINKSIQEKSLTVVCDMNGSARTLTIDKEFFNSQGIDFESFNDTTGDIVHAIIPEGKNLEFCAKKIEELQINGKTDALLGYMPDCDGDRGNIVFWNNKKSKAEILQAQEVFALAVLSELAHSVYKSNNEESLKLAVAVNCATSMRIEDIAKAFNAKVFRGEVGEANIVNCAREQREKGYNIPIMGEGSNGGNITHPAAVRDPINTLFALIKLLVIRSTQDKKGLFELWCIASNQEEKYKVNFTLVDILATLPQYATTGASESRALMSIKSRDHAVLKQNFQKVFQEDWDNRKIDLKNMFGFYSWQAACTVGTKETTDIDDFSMSGTGGLKIRFMDNEGAPIASIWMRGSGTEPVFRVMADIKNGTESMEKELVSWETELLVKADQM